jgi:PAS domain S-box-containing protein
MDDNLETTARKRRAFWIRPPWKPRRIDLGFQLLALYLLFVGPVVIAALAFDVLVSRQLSAEVEAADLALARAVALETNTFIDSALQAVRQMGTHQSILATDLDGMSQIFSNIFSVRSDVNLIYRLDPAGVMVYHYPEGPESTVGWDFSFREYYQRARTTRSPLISKGRISPTTHQAVATAVMPLWDSQGQYLGLVASNIKLQFLSHTLGRIVSENRPEAEFRITIVDSAGQVIADSDPSVLLQDGLIAFPDAGQAVLDGNSGSMTRVDPGGTEMLFSYVPVTSAKWGVVVGRPTALAFGTVREIHNGILAAMVLFLLFGLIFWISLANRVIRPLEKLTDFSRAIGTKTEFLPAQRKELDRLAQRSDQMGHLTRSLRRMEQAIEARFIELSTLLATSAAVVSTLDPQIVLERILEQVERLLGIEMCAIVALDEHTGKFRSRASRGLSEGYVQRLEIDPHEPQSVTLRAIRSGGPVQISDTEQDPAFRAMRPRAADEGYRSVLAMPLNTKHAPPSTLLVYHPQPHQFTDQEIDLLSSFANHAAMAIENAALYSQSGIQLKEQTRRLEALVQSLLNGLILEDLEGNVLYANRSLSELTGLPVEQIHGSPVDRLHDRLLDSAKDRRITKQALEAVLGGKGQRSVEIALRRPEGLRHLRLQIFDVTDSDGTPIGRGQIFQDITQLREIDRMKSSLVSTVSHELRTPLAAIKGYATTLLAEDVEWDSVTQREFLNIISDEADRLSEMVNNLLDMSRIEAGNLTVSRIPCDLEELIRNAAQRADPHLDTRLTVSIPTGIPTLMADPQRIEVVLRNLIENAKKYAGEQSIIRVSAAVENNKVVVRVDDQGPGIPAEHAERVFDSFYRVESGLRRQIAGAGLGLAISQGFVRAHGGQIWLEPRSRGTCVAFSLPLAQAEADAGSGDAAPAPSRETA